MFRWLTGMKSLISEWYTPGERKSGDRLRILVSNYNWNMVAQLIGGSFWTGLLLIIQADDSFVGMAAMIPYLSYTLQLMSPLLFERFQHRKKIVLTFKTVYYVIQTVLIGLIPVFPLEAQARLTLLLLILLVSNGLHALQNPASQVWTLQSLPEKVRPAFYSTLGATVNLVCAAVPLLGGLMVDSLKAKGMEYQGLLVLRLIALGLVIFDIILCAGIREYPYEGTREKFHAKELLTLPFREKKYRRTILAASLDAFVVSIPGQYYTLYLLNDVGMSYTFINTVNFCVMVIVSVSVVWWKPVLQRWSWMKILGCGSLFYMAYLIGISFAHRGAEWVFVVFSIFCAFTASPTRTLAGQGLPYQNIPQKRQSVYLSAYLSFSNFAAMLGVFFGRCFVMWTAPRVLDVFGVEWTNRQYLCIFAGILCGVAGLATMRMGTEKARNPGTGAEESLTVQKAVE